jgi:hypothetical protein
MVPLFEAVSIPFVAQFLDDEQIVQPNDLLQESSLVMLDALVRTESALRVLRAPSA